jgi:hypothetical protein
MPEHIPITSYTTSTVLNSADSVQATVKENLHTESLYRSPIQWKLSIGNIDDPLEYEADTMADKVMRMPESNFIQRKCAACEEEEKAQRKPLTSFIQKKEAESNNVASDSISNQIQSTKNNGNAMHESTKSFMESRFGTDFSNVHIHAGSYASQLSDQLNAQAFTVGNNIYFNEGKYQPESYAGKHLLAHELTHTLQQEGNTAIQRQTNGAGVPAAIDTGSLSDAMLEQIAKRLRDAMEGWGTDESAIYAAFAGRTQSQVNAIERAYANRYKRSLIADLQDELNEDEMKHLAIFSPTAVEGKPNGSAELIAYQLRDAMAGWGTDESAIMSALTGRTVSERIAIKDAYKKLTNHDLRADLIDELSGTDLITALRLLEQGLLNTEDQIYLAVAGLGTDEESLADALGTIKGNRSKILATIDAYKAKGYGDLLADVRDDLSGDDLAQSMESLHGGTNTRTCNPVQRKMGLIAISEATSMAQKAIDMLSADIARGQLSSNIESNLKDNFNSGNAVGVVNIGLARSVLNTFINVRRDLLMTSDVDCGDTNLCVGKQDCSPGQSFVAAWTGVGSLSTVQLCTSFFSCTSNPSTTMLHEFVHHTGVHDHFYHFAPGFSNLTPLGNQSANDSLDNADSYAYFAESL